VKPDSLPDDHAKISGGDHAGILKIEYLKRKLLISC
jgi:hypothetical protein